MSHFQAVNGTAIFLEYVPERKTSEDLFVVAIHTQESGSAAAALTRLTVTELCREMYRMLTFGGHADPLVRPDRPVTLRLERGDFLRASGDVECTVCYCLYREHTECRGYPTVHILCNGTLVKT